MREYIDREKMYMDFKECNTKNPKWTPQRVATLIYRQHTADVEHVIHCKDCKYWGDEDGIITTDDGIRYARCWFHTYNNDDGGHHGWCPKESDFCSLGELKENGNG